MFYLLSSSRSVTMKSVGTDWSILLFSASRVAWMPSSRGMWVYNPVTSMVTNTLFAGRFSNKTVKN